MGIFTKSCRGLHAGSNKYMKIQSVNRFIVVNPSYEPLEKVRMTPLTFASISLLPIPFNKDQLKQICILLKIIREQI